LRRVVSRIALIARVLVLGVAGLIALGAAGCGGDGRDEVADQFIDQLPEVTAEQEDCIRGVFADVPDEQLDEFEAVGTGDADAADVSQEARDVASELIGCTAGGTGIPAP
jgi:hypothetical protein